MMNTVLSGRIDNAGRWAAIAIGCAIPVSVVLDNLLLLVVLVCWLAGGNYVHKLAKLRDNPVSLCALALFGLLLLGLLWGDQPVEDGRRYLLKYLDLAFVPLFIYYFRNPATRRHGLLALASTLALVLALSFLVKAGLLAQGGWVQGSPQSPVVFKFRITHNFLMAFGAFLYTWLAFSAPAGSRGRIFWGLLAMLAAVNVTLMVEGVTGYLALGVLALLLVATLLPRRIAIAGFIAVPLLALALLAVPGPLAQRIVTLNQELQSWHPDVAARDSSAGLRIEFYRNTLEIIADHPLIGTGTGGLPTAYADRVRGTDMLATHNPHNEYLHIAVQIGLLGLTAMLLMFAVQWRSARQLPTAQESGLARGLVLAMAVGCLFNSMLLDHAEGLFFAWLSGLLFAGLPGKKTIGISS
jgi:O-antigen ligase